MTQIKVDFGFFGAPAGSVYDLQEGTYDMEICDCCGNKRKCDLFICENEDPCKTVFLDLCRSCRNRHSEPVGEAEE